MADIQVPEVSQDPVFQIQRVYLKDVSLEQPNSPAILLEQESPTVDIQLGVVRRMLAENGIRLEYTDKAREWIAAAGYDPLYGARPVKRTIQRYVVNDLSKRILAGDVNREQPIRIDADDKGLTFAN